MQHNTNAQEAQEMQTLPFSRTHRTALVVDVRRGIDKEFEERVKRVFESVGGPHVKEYNGSSGIKVDVFTLSGPEATLSQGTTLPATPAPVAAVSSDVVTLSPGSPFQVAKPATPAVESEATVLADLDDTLAKKGYVQILHVRNLNAKK